MLILTSCVIDLSLIIKAYALSSKLLKQSLSRLFELSRGLTDFLNDLLIGEVLEAIMNVRTLMEDLQKALSTVEETLLDCSETFSLLSGSCRVFYDFVKYWLVIFHRVFTLN